MRLLFVALGALLLLADRTIADDFPQVFEHRYGTTIVENRPRRVVSLSFGGHDNLLALGVVPVALRYWYSGNAHGVWPWAEGALGDAQPVVLKGDLNIEKIATLRPDLIVALASGIRRDQYALLSRIAPTIAAQAQYSDWNTPWEVKARTVARAVGQTGKAAALIGAIDARLTAVAGAHPDWRGKTAAFATYWDGQPRVYTSYDPRAQFLARLGFVTPETVDAAAGNGAFYVAISGEDLSPIDADLLVWGHPGGALRRLQAMPLRKAMRAHREGREVFAPDLLTGALSHASLSSLPFAIDALVPLIEKAMDGDPRTAVPTTVAAGLVD